MTRHGHAGVTHAPNAASPRRAPALCLAVVLAGLTQSVLAADAGRAALAEMFKKASPAVVTLRATYTKKAADTTQQAVNTHLGVIVSEDGLVLFPGSGIPLIDSVSNILVDFGATQAPARYVGYAKGVAFAQLEPEKKTRFPFLSFDPARRVEVGEEIFAIGSLGAAYNNARTLTGSRVAAVIAMPTELYVFGRKDVLQGAPVLTADGVAVGVIGIDEEFYNIAIRHPNRQQALEALLSQPTVLPASRLIPLIKTPPRNAPDDYAKRGWIGAAIEVLAPDVAAELAIKDRRGVYVSYVVPGSAVAAAGLKQGDVIIAWAGLPAAGQTAAELLEFRRIILDTAPGTEVEFEVHREGKTLTLKAKIENTPPGYDQAPATTIAALGLAVKPLTYDVKLSYRLDWDAGGVIVSWVAPGGAAGLAGLAALDVIKEIDGVPPKDPAAFTAAVAAAQKEKKTEIVLLLGKERNTKSAIARIRLAK